MHPSPVWILVALCVGTAHAGKRFHDCHERWLSGETVPGVYEIHPNGTDSPTKVYCDHSVGASGTVIQSRKDGLVSFHQPYAVYQRGFGNAGGEYWAGLDVISALTNAGNHVLRIEMTDWAENRRWAQYNSFIVKNSAQYYQMVVSGFSGNVLGDDLSYQSGNYFFTYDAPDQYNCAPNMRGGWWYYYCAYAHLNGVYYKGYYPPNSAGFYDGIYWKDWTRFDYSLKTVTMSLFRG